ncbi:sensor histidine kinase [Serinicoccus kebangsaanensis]|uniref:sensor histidine kinase n=1 Tax=Serinicoccus kebangsaanensis TaxID=2602069 RepID=UPI00192DEFE0|nr:sensor histidine kinase [Serinicoccus kebangsaanensis]
MSEDRLLRLLPFGLLALATAVAVAARPALGDAAAGLPATLALTGVTALWLLLLPTGQVGWWGRSALAFVLCWLNPFYAIFACVGFVDVFVLLKGPRLYAALALVAVTLAGAQSGGFPPDDRLQGIVFAALVLLNLGLVGYFGALAQHTEQRKDELERVNAELERVIAENERLHEQLLAQARRSGALEERQRLAREIHDTTAQSLAGIVAQLEASVGGERQERALTLARDALADARRSMLDLSPRGLDGASLVEALRDLVATWAREREVRADVVVTGDATPLHPEVEATVLRIAQESLTNVGKHARAQRVGVTLSYDDTEIVLDVRDDGVGFDPGAPRPTSSFGLRGMRQRAERLAGELEVESRPGDGTAFSLRLPALAREAA